jgi:hypothetical protein
MINALEYQVSKLEESSYRDNEEKLATLKKYDALKVDYRKTKESLELALETLDALATKKKYDALEIDYKKTKDSLEHALEIINALEYKDH